MYIPGMTFSSSSTTLTTAVPVSLTVPPKTTWSTTIRTSSRVCGSPAIFSRIVGGTDAVDGEWPWQVVLYVGGTFICGGSLISEQWVLSAAHCFDYSSYPSYYTISLGMYRLGGSNPHGVTVEVEQIIKNSQYTYTGVRGDIALVKLKIPVAFNDYIHPICLPAASISFLSGMECWVTGWGTRSSGGSISSLNTLQKVMTPLIDYKQCDQMYHIGSSISTDITIILEESICSGYKEGGKDSCQGDSGGPLVCKVNGTWFQAGVVSWGDGCALANRPGVYTLVPAYESWIKTNVPELLFHNVIPESTNPPDSPEGSASRYCTSWTLVLFSVLSLTLF
uniref:Peptidase S1 domain-containing protein n=1 Tax=Leptobrachium leishanense TaxID=445787 RepID=A0A8C5Q2H5_9ANUR